MTCLGTINENEKIVLDIILKDPNITIAEIANQSNKSIRTINRIIVVFTKRLLNFEYVVQQFFVI